MTLPHDHPCKGCGACCTYVTIQIDEPKEPLDYDTIVWYLLHRNVRVVLDSEGDWLVEFHTPCKKLEPGLHCGDYENRPGICEDFDPGDCHGKAMTEGEKLGFDDAESFKKYLKEKGITYEPRAIAAKLKAK